MAAQPLPEIKRTPLESLLLQIKSTRPDADVRDYLSKALDPPQVKAIETAWATLRLLGAVEVKEGKNELSAKLTPLGCHLAMIPVDLRLAKVSSLYSVLALDLSHGLMAFFLSLRQMLVLAAIFRCLDPVRSSRMSALSAVLPHAHRRSDCVSFLSDSHDSCASFEQALLPESAREEGRVEKVSSEQSPPMESR